MELDLYLDESGSFEESEEATASVSSKPARIKSQLVGLLAKRGALNEKGAEEVLRNAFSKAGLNLDREVHASEIQDRESYQRLVTAVADGVSGPGWQPVRLVNDAALGFGDRVATYTRMVAELLLRITEQKRREGVSSGSFRIVAASVKLGNDKSGATQIIERDDYIRRIQETLAFAAVRRGVAAEMAAWKLDGFKLGFGKTWRELQLCDVLSNASHTGFKRCDAEVASRLKVAFGTYNFTLRIVAVAARAGELLEIDAVGLALRNLAEALSAPDVSELLRSSTDNVLHDTQDRLASLGGPARNVHLAELINWLEQLIDVQRSLDLGLRVASWLRSEVAAKLRQALPELERHTIDWFEYALARWALTAHNHHGNVTAAAGESKRIDALLPSIAGRWERATLMLDGLVAQAVHLTDSFNYDNVASRMRPVTENYRILADLTHEALPGIFPERIRSEVRGKALGTWLQAELFAGLNDPTRLDVARTLNDQAIDEFVDPSDKQRQYQYRSQIEAAAGALARAREWLAKSFDLTEASHVVLGGAVRDMPGIVQGFGLLHWTRIARTAAANADLAELDAFVEAFDRTRLAYSAWCTTPDQNYPAHGIRRNVAVVFAAANRADEALAMLGHLRSLNNLGQNQLVLILVELAAMVEIAAFLQRGHSKKARRLLDSSEPGRPGVKQILARVLDNFAAHTANHHRLLDGWVDSIARAIDPTSSQEDSKAVLLALARRVGY